MVLELTEAKRNHVHSAEWGQVHAWAGLSSLSRSRWFGSEREGTVVFVTLSRESLQLSILLVPGRKRLPSQEKTPSS